VVTGEWPPRPVDWESMTRAQRKTWKKRGDKQRGCPITCDLGGALLPPSLGKEVRIAAAHGMAEAAGVGAAQATGAKAAAEAESVTAGVPSGQRPKPANWESMTKAQL